MPPQEENVFGVYKFGKCSFLPEEQMDGKPISSGSPANLSPFQTARSSSPYILKTLFHDDLMICTQSTLYVISLAGNVNAKHAAAGGSRQNRRSRDLSDRDIGAAAAAAGKEGRKEDHSNR